MSQLAHRLLVAFDGMRFFVMRTIKIGTLSALLGWPLFSTWNAFVLSCAGVDRAEKFITFLKFTPGLILSGAIWAAFWGLAVWQVLGTIWP
jgi:hypothetical protein